MFNNDDWLDQVIEPILETEREIVDPHHHLWPQPAMSYNLTELQRDTSSGHKIVQTVFMECGASYLDTGPDHLRPTGETIFVANAAAQAIAVKSETEIAGIVAHADLTHPELDTILDAHESASRSLFRGIRHAGARDTSGAPLMIPGPAPEGLYADPVFRSGVARLGVRGLTYDTWHYHHQNRDFLNLVKAVPETTCVLDHFGTPLGVGQYAEHREEIFYQWQKDVADIAKCPNVVAKLGGLAMPDNGFGWNTRDVPPGSDEFVEAQGQYYHHMIACFGAERCMFESNFPVDRLSLSYRTLWNAFKKIASGYSEAEKDALFSGTARRVYRL